MVKLKCYHCHSENLVRNGKTNNGKQRYRCHDCGKMSRDYPQSNGYAETAREQILRAYQERSSLRGLTRTFGVAHNTVTAWLKKKLVMPELAATLVLPKDQPLTLELDELWSFVLKKARKRWI